MPQNSLFSRGFVLQPPLLKETFFSWSSFPPPPPLKIADIFSGTPFFGFRRDIPSFPSPPFYHCDPMLFPPLPLQCFANPPPPSTCCGKCPLPLFSPFGFRRSTLLFLLPAEHLRFFLGDVTSGPLFLPDGFSLFPPRLSQPKCVLSFSFFLSPLSYSQNEGSFMPFFSSQRRIERTLVSFVEKR